MNCTFYLRRLSSLPLAPSTPSRFSRTCRTRRRLLGTRGNRFCCWRCPPQNEIQNFELVPRRKSQIKKPMMGAKEAEQKAQQFEHKNNVSEMRRMLEPSVSSVEHKANQIESKANEEIAEYQQNIQMQELLI